MERRRNGDSPSWVLLPQRDGEYIFFGPYAKRDAKIMARNVEGMVAKEQPSMKESAVKLVVDED